MRQAYIYKATCERVIDGDTLQMIVDLGFHLTTRIRVRLLDVDTPELRSSIGEERAAAQRAKTFVIQWTHKRDLTVRTEKADSFGRWLGDIERDDGANLCKDLLEAGHAVPWSK